MNAWFEEARLGMMVHFGLYSTTQGFWDGKEVDFIGEWIQARFEIPVEEYKNKLTPLMTLSDFNAKDYVSLAKKAGMKYIIFTTKHHDGFALFDSKVSDYTVTKLCTPDRDPIKELADECHAQGLKLCFYYSHALDWEDPDAFGNDWDYKTEEKNYETYLHGKCLGQLKELLTNYGEVSMIWFDVPRGIKQEWAVEIKKFVKSIQPNCMINGRIMQDPFAIDDKTGERLADYASSGDNEVPYVVLRKGVWETTATHNNTWGYKLNDKNFRTPRELKDTFVALLSTNANYALNIGPDQNGGIPKETVRDFEAFGEWVQKYGEAIYGTSGSPFDYDVAWGKIVSKQNNIYLFVQEKTENIVLTGLSNKVVKVTDLDRPEQAIAFTQKHHEQYHRDELHIEGTYDGTDDIKVLKVELIGEPDGKKGFYQLADGSVQLFAAQGVLTGSNEKKAEDASVGENLNAADAEKDNNFSSEGRYVDDNGVVRNWLSEDGNLTVDFTLDEIGKYEVSIYTRPKKYEVWTGGHTVRVQIADQQVAKKITADAKYITPNTRCYDDRISCVGTLEIAKAGQQQLVLSLDQYEKPTGARRDIFKGDPGFCIFRIDLKRVQ